MASHKIKIIIEEIEKKNYHLFIELEIGEKASRLLLDTGASKTVFDKEKVLKFVTEKKIRKHESKSVGLGVSNVETRIVKLKNLRFGNMKMDKIEVAVLDLDHVNQTYKLMKLKEIDGVLGSDFLMKYKAIINYEKRLMTIKK